VDASIDAKTNDIPSADIPLPETSAERARRDIVDGLKQWPIWTALAWQDIRTRYIRTLLGPLWITVSMAVFVFAMGFVFSAVFNTDFHGYLPFLTSGLLVWGLISGIITEAATTFSSAQLIILSVSAPYSMHVYRAVLRQVIIFSHNILVFVGVILIAGVPVTWATLLVFPGLLLLCIILAWINLVLAMIGTRFRDLQPIIASMLQLMFFLTPLIWNRGQIAGKAHSLWVDANPFYHLIEIMRAPMLGKPPELLTVAAVFAMAIVGWYLTYLLFARFRRRIPYWL
jgi:ABC-type polysaccharide/polyol phosphate export permease